MPASISSYTGDGHARLQRFATMCAWRLMRRDIFANSPDITFPETPIFSASRRNLPGVIHLNAYSSSIFIAIRLSTSGYTVVLITSYIGGRVAGVH